MNLLSYIYKRMKKKSMRKLVFIVLVTDICLNAHRNPIMKLRPSKEVNRLSVGKFIKADVAMCKC